MPKSLKKVLIFLCLFNLRSGRAQNEGVQLWKIMKSPENTIMGPYQVRVLKTGACVKKPTDYIPNNPVSYNIEHYKKKREDRIRGNVSIAMDVQSDDVKMRVATFVLDTSREKLTEMSGMDCRRYIVRALTLALNLTVDHDTCTYKKGVYTFDNLDVNSIVHVVISKMTYARYEFEVEWYANRGVYACITIAIQTVKIFIRP